MLRLPELEADDIAGQRRAGRGGEYAGPGVARVSGMIEGARGAAGPDVGSVCRLRVRPFPEDRGHSIVKPFRWAIPPGTK